MSTEVKQNTFKDRVIGVIEQILPSSEVKLEEIREEVWRDLSALYYKYEDEDQKKAFREVMYDICERIKDGRWESVYNKLYRFEQKEKAF